MDKEKIIQTSLLGGFLGDIIGVPYEFLERDTFVCKKIDKPNEESKHDVELGAWSDDTSLTLCLIDAFIKGYDKDIYYKNMCNWYHKGVFTHDGKLPFDVGGSCARGIVRLQSNLDNPKGALEESNGNGALMRIFPLVFTNYDCNNIEEVKELFLLIQEIAHPTHAHYISDMCCLYYILYCKNIYKGVDKYNSFIKTREIIEQFSNNNIVLDLHNEVINKKREDLKSDGYVYNTLLNSLWCFYYSKDYKESVLKVVNLGGDTDTHGLVTGHLAALNDCVNNKKIIMPIIPLSWSNKIQNKDYLLDMIKSFSKSV